MGFRGVLGSECTCAGKGRDTRRGMRKVGRRGWLFLLQEGKVCVCTASLARGGREAKNRLGNLGMGRAHRSSDKE
eukprot:scaffold26406_cov67-Isochrysis_galbana.AAC.1